MKTDWPDLCSSEYASGLFVDSIARYVLEALCVVVWQQGVLSEDDLVRGV